MGMVGCSATYKGVVKPTPKMADLSPEMAALTEAGINEYLNANVKTEFPTVLAVARIRPRWDFRDANDRAEVAVISGEEAEGWRKLTQAKGPDGRPFVSQIHLVSPLLVPQGASLKTLRDATALLHAPILLVYSQEDNHEEGYNSAAMAYWTIIGLFLVPGNTVGHYSACAAVLVDTRSNAVLATADGESKKEENVLAGAVEIARSRTQAQSRTEAIAHLQGDFSGTLAALAQSSVASSAPPPAPVDVSP